VENQDSTTEITAILNLSLFSVKCFVQGFHAVCVLSSFHIWLALNGSVRVKSGKSRGGVCVSGIGAICLSLE